ncbi:hypothetical protein [Nocardioides sp.]|uniref:hypothetical protein n=1 Tax=Nocardioides sp. TaxID=35761 RepID=UPI0035115E39
MVAVPGAAGPFRLGLRSWLLEDGSLEGFEVGQERAFALEFGYSRTDRLRLRSPADAPVDALTYAGHDARYEVTGVLVDTEGHTCIESRGLRMYRQHTVFDSDVVPERGSVVSGRISLQIAPELSSWSRVLAVARWRVLEIHGRPQPRADDVAGRRQDWRPLRSTDRWADLDYLVVAVPNRN